MQETSRDVTTLVRLAEICGVRLNEAADKAEVSRRAVQNWQYKQDVSPRKDLYERVWNATLQLARERGWMNETVERRIREELGVIV